MLYKWLLWTADSHTAGDVGDLRLSDIGELLRDYRRLGAIVALANSK